MEIDEPIGAGASGRLPGEPPDLRPIVKYVLSPSSVKLEDLPWKECCDETIGGTRVGFVVYRGQSGATASSIPRVGKTPMEIRLDFGRPLSTSTQLNQHIESFAAPPGRIFLIHVTPGVRYVDIRKTLRDPKVGAFLDSYRDLFFKSIQDGFPVENRLKTQSVSQVMGEFWRRIAKENEVILDPRDAEFRSELGPETWDRRDGSKDPAIVPAVVEEVYTKPSKEKDPETGKPIHRPGQKTGVTRVVDVYETGMFPKKKGGRRLRGRTFRRKPMRRNKNGGRPTRKSKHRRD